MKILLALDDSACSDAVLQTVLDRPWPARSVVRVISVVHVVIPFVPDPALIHATIHMESLEKEREIARQIVAKAAERLGREAPELEVSTSVLEGAPKELILDEAECWGADLVIVGSHGRGAVKRLFFGSVSHAVVLHAPCSVEIVRCRDREAPPATTTPPESTGSDTATER